MPRTEQQGDFHDITGLYRRALYAMTRVVGSAGRPYRPFRLRPSQCVHPSSCPDQNCIFLPFDRVSTPVTWPSWIILSNVNK